MFSIITAISWLEEEVKIGPIKISPEDIEKWINKIISIAIIIVLMYLIIKIGNKIIDKIVKKQIKRTAECLWSNANEVRLESLKFKGK